MAKVCVLLPAAWVLNASEAHLWQCFDISKYHVLNLLSSAGDVCVKYSAALNCLHSASAAFWSLHLFPVQTKASVCSLPSRFHPNLRAGRTLHRPLHHFLRAGVLGQEGRHGRPVHLQHSAPRGGRAGVLSCDLHHHL